MSGANETGGVSGAGGMGGAGGMSGERIDKVLAPVPVERQREREERVRRDFWSHLKRFAGRIPFAHDLVAAYHCATDPATPLKVRGTLFAALAYFVLPIDVLPDMVALIGFTDDMAVLMAAISLVGAHMKPEHRERARQTLADL